MEQIKAEEHLGLVRKVALQHVSPGTKVDDTEEYSDGLMGLFNAIKGYDPEKNIEFSTYATHCIKNAIVQGIRLRTAKKKQLLKPVSLEIDYAQKTKINNFSLIEYLFADHPEDRDVDKENKNILYRNYILGETWDKIGKELGVSRMRALQRGQLAIALLKKRFANDIASFSEFDNIFG